MKGQKRLKICIIRHGLALEDPRIRKEALALVEMGHSVDIICLHKRARPAWQRYDGINVFRLPLTHKRQGFPRYFFEYALSFIMVSILLSYLHVCKQYDRIQVNTLPDFLVFVTLIPKLFGAKIILDMHEAMPELFTSNFGFGKTNLLTKIVESLERISTKYADYVLAVCNQTMQLHICRGLSPSKAMIVHNVPDECLFDYRKYNQTRKENGEFTLISHGSVLERYGFQVLIKAISYLKKDIPKIRLSILGDGEYLPSLRKLTEEKNLANYVSFRGRIPLEQVPLAIHAADVGVVPIVKDEFTELMAPNKLFEYVAMRKPVVATRTKGMLDYFDDSCVMFFESGNEKELAECILELYRNPDRAKDLVENAWSRYEKFRWNVTKQVYLKVFAE
jgi:glycosyltransferase involved in cell wall biosynthesis